MNGDLLLKAASSFASKLDSIKNSEACNFQWYPYGSMNNFVHLRDIFNSYPLDALMPNNGKILDVGAADGDVSFFL